MYSNINNLYNFNTVEYDGLEFPFDMTWKNVSIASSGGADSTLLLYILCDIITRHNLECTIHVIHNTRCWKTKPWQEHIGETIYNTIKTKFSNLVFMRHVNFVPPALEHGSGVPNIVDDYGKLQSGDTIELQSFSEYVAHKFKIDAYFNAVTRNPTIEIEGALPRRNIDPSTENSGLMFKKLNSFYVCHPFRFVSKDYIVKQYHNFDIVDILNMTRSCEGVFDNIDYTNYIPGQFVPECNNCFWCRERNWAKNYKDHIS